MDRDTHLGSTRSAPAFEARLSENRDDLLSGFSRSAALAKSKVGTRQIQRYAEIDGQRVFVTDTPDDAFEYLGIAPHPVQ